MAGVCRGKQRSSKCGEELKIKECREEAEGCCNYGGPHTVNHGGCEERKKAVEMIKQPKNSSEES